MEPNTTALERAFELARSGCFLAISELRLKLASEGYRTDVLEGPILIGQLKTAIEQSKAHGVAALNKKSTL